MSSCSARDVGVSGGVFRATAGLQQRFGSERVIDTPLSETLISGLCIGMAAQGLHPVGEIQFMGFIYPCIDQLVNHASRLRNRTQGRLSCPMVPQASKLACQNKLLGLPKCEYPSLVLSTITQAIDGEARTIRAGGPWVRG